MEMETVTFSLEKKIKEEVEVNLCELGLTWSDFIKEAVWQRFPNQETLEAIEEVEEMIRTGHYGKTYSDVGDMMKELLKRNMKW